MVVISISYMQHPETQQHELSSLDELYKLIKKLESWEAYLKIETRETDDDKPAIVLTLVDYPDPGW